MDKRIIQTSEAPAAIGPYSQGVQCASEVYVSGQLPVHPVSGIMAPDIVGQTRQSLKNIEAVLAEAGLHMDHIVKVNAYLSNMNDFEEMNKVYTEFFKSNYPARAVVQVARLPKNAMVEIEAIAKI